MLLSSIALDKSRVFVPLRILSLFTVSKTNEWLGKAFIIKHLNKTVSKKAFLEKKWKANGQNFCLEEIWKIRKIRKCDPFVLESCNIYLQSVKSLTLVKYLLFTSRLEEAAL